MSTKKLSQREQQIIDQAARAAASLLKRNRASLQRMLDHVRDKDTAHEDEGVESMLIVMLDEAYEIVGRRRGGS